MKRITFSADAGLIDAARAKAGEEGTTLTERGREWLAAYAERREMSPVAKADDARRGKASGPSGN